MRILIMSIGSRGDVQPYVALGKGLKQAGHLVRFLTFENFKELICDNGLEFIPVRGDVQEGMSQIDDIMNGSSRKR